MGRLARMHVRRLHPPGGGEPLTVLVASRFRERLLGLAGLRSLPAGTALMIPRCHSVHTFGMRFQIDVVFATVETDRLVVHDARSGVGPCRVVRASRRAQAHPGLAALELPAGSTAVRAAVREACSIDRNMSGRSCTVEAKSPRARD